MAGTLALVKGCPPLLPACAHPCLDTNQLSSAAPGSPPTPQRSQLPSGGRRDPQITPVVAWSCTLDLCPTHIPPPHPQRPVSDPWLWLLLLLLKAALLPASCTPLPPTHQPQVTVLCHRSFDSQQAGPKEMSPNHASALGEVLLSQAGPGKRSSWAAEKGTNFLLSLLQVRHFPCI